METLHAIGKDININLNGVTICYDDFGVGEIPIIFIHGFPFNKSSWQPQMDHLKKTNRVIAYDIRGYGKSTSGQDEQSIRLFADDLVNFMDALEINKAIVCGLSMGGYILLNAVYRYANRFRALILSDTQCISDPAEVKEKRYNAIAQVIAGKLKDFTEGSVKNIFCPESLGMKKELVDNIRDIILTTAPLTISGGLNALAKRWEMCSTLHEIDVPTLILCGKEDTVTPVVQSAFMHSHIENSELHVIDNAGHLSNLEQPDAFNQYLDNFISKMD